MESLEAEAGHLGCRAFVLETGPTQPEALMLYERMGYRRRGPFGGYPEHPLSVFMQKNISRETVSSNEIQYLQTFSHRDTA